MKKILKLSSLFTSAVLAASVSLAYAGEYTVKTEKLNQGQVQIYDYGIIKLHAYDTEDPMNDVLYAVETDEGLVLLESTALKKNVEEFSNYLKTVKKELKGELLSYHPNGYNVYNSTVYATQGALESWNTGSVKALTEQFSQGFGKDSVAEEMPESASIISIGDTLSLGGTVYRIIDGMTPEGHFDVVIPKINAVYTHMMGSDVHNILPSLAAIDNEIKRFEKIHHDGYDLILTSHYMPETQAGVMQKLVYLKKVRELANKCRNRQEFTAALREAFPSYKGEQYLKMTASMLFKN